MLDGYNSLFVCIRLLPLYKPCTSFTGWKQSAIRLPLAFLTDVTCGFCRQCVIQKLWWHLLIHLAYLALWWTRDVQRYNDIFFSVTVVYRSSITPLIQMTEQQSSKTNYKILKSWRFQVRFQDFKISNKLLIIINLSRFQQRSARFQAYCGPLLLGYIRL